MVDPAARHLVVAGEPGKDRQPGRIGGRPARGTQLVRAQVPDRAGAGGPAVPTGGGIRGVELVEAAAAAVDDDHVAIAVRAPASLDRHVTGNRVAAAVRLVRVLERDRNLALVARDGRVRDPDRGALPRAGAEVGMHVGVEADAPDEPRRARFDRQLVDSLIPRVVAREHGAARGAAERVGGRKRDRHKSRDAGHHYERALHFRSPPA